MHIDRCEGHLTRLDADIRYYMDSYRREVSALSAARDRLVDFPYAQAAITFEINKVCQYKRCNLCQSCCFALHSI
jgi:hypothetical protein